MIPSKHNGTRKFWLNTLYTVNLDNGNTVMKPNNSHRRMIVFSKMEC